MRRKPTNQPARCACNHVTEVAQWTGKRGSGGLSTRGGAAHGNPFSGRGNCIHDELQHTTRDRRHRRRTTKRLRVA